MAVYASTNVKVYPSAYRGKNAGGKMFNPESRLNVESNIVRPYVLLSDFADGNFVIAYTAGSNLEFVVHGYYFKVSGVTLSGNQYAHIVMKAKGDTVTTGNIAVEAYSLVPNTGTGDVLDDSTTNTFVGLVIDNSSEYDPTYGGDVYTLQLFNGTSVPEQSKIKYKQTSICGGVQNDVRRSLDQYLQTVDASITNNLYVEQALEVTDGDVTLHNGDLKVVSSNATIGGTLTAGGKLTISSGGAEITGTVTIKGSVLEGDGSQATGYAAHAEGSDTHAEGSSSHAEGIDTTASGNCSHSEGANGKASGMASHAEGSDTHAEGSSSHAEGDITTASGNASHAEGNDTVAYGNYSHAEGIESKALGIASHAECNGSIAYGDDSHAEGSGTTGESGGAADGAGKKAHAEGIGSKALGIASHAEGINTQAGTYSSITHTLAGSGAHAEGDTTIASGSASHAEGSNTHAEGSSSHAEGDTTIASGSASHAEGDTTTASGNASHAEGFGTIASGNYSHAAGVGTTANQLGQTVVGKYNYETSSGAVFAVGGGTNDSNKHTVFEVFAESSTGNEDGYATVTTVSDTDLKSIVNRAFLNRTCRYLKASNTAVTLKKGTVSTSLSTAAYSQATYVGDAVYGYKAVNWGSIHFTSSAEVDFDLTENEVIVQIPAASSIYECTWPWSMKIIAGSPNPSAGFEAAGVLDISKTTISNNLVNLTYKVACTYPSRYLSLDRDQEVVIILQ